MSAAPTDGRARARRRGIRAERAAAAWLRLKGYRVLARGFTGGGGEIDVVARRGRALVFIEVKYRADLAPAAESIGAAKRARCANAARAWLAAHPADAGLEARFDAVLILPWRLPVHVTDAWR